MSQALPNVGGGDEISADPLNRIAEEVQSRTIMRIAGMNVQQRSTGTVVSKRPTGLQPGPRRGGGTGVARVCPFDITITETAGPTFTATFQPGIINGLLPSNYLTGVVVPASGTRYLVLSCTASNGEITAAAFAADSTVPDAIAPSAGEPPTAFKLLIGVCIDAVATKVWGCGNIQAEGAESFRIQKVSPTAGQLPYDVYYTWNLQLLS